MSLTYNVFYRKFGIRLLPQLINPILSDLKFLDFPLESIYHYLSFDGITDGPAMDDFLFRNDHRSIPVETISELTVLEGHPRHTGNNVNQVMQHYYSSHHRMRKIRDIHTYLRDKPTVIVFNYALLPKIYKYPTNIYSMYYKWKNIFATVLAKAAAVAQETNRQQYMMLEVPKVIPSVTQLNTASKALSSTSLKAFKDSNSLVLLELWKWFSDERETSLFATIPRNKIHLINFVFQESGKWCVLNLGMLNSFYKDSNPNADAPEIAKEDDYVIKSKQAVTGLQLGKRLVRLMITLMEVRTLTSKLANQEENEVVIRGTDKNPDAVVDDTEAVEDDEVDVSEEDTKPEFDYTEPYKEQLADAISNGEIDHDVISEMSPEEFQEHVTKEDHLLDEVLSQLDDIAVKIDSDDGHPNYNLQEIINSQETLNIDSGVVKLCDSLASDGMLSPIEYKKFIRLANSYKEIKSVDGVTPLSEFIVIPPETLKIESSEKLADTSTVLDKSMLHSSLSAFDSRYIKDVLHKDYANTILAVQKTGIAVSSYKVEKVNDILGGYETHTLRINPVIGMQSTLRFKMPIVNEDGSYKTNGVLYSLRNQRRDLPIRKTGPNRVSLTSYYGKVFILSGKKASSNYCHWLVSQFALSAINGNDTHITGVIYGNCFDQSLVGPKAYTALSNTIRTCLVSGFEVCFDRDYILKNYPSTILKAYEYSGDLVIGRTPINDTYLIINQIGVVHSRNGKLEEPLGTLEEFLNISIMDAPVEYATASVFGKDIPIGVILGIELGFENLLRLLKITPRRILAGERTKLMPDEYALYFNDETLIFNRENKLASMIIGGFDEYHRTLKQFSVYSFDKRGVYVNLLEANGIGVRFVREIDLLNTMFVDPITRDILIEMKEPITYQGLLFKACQMLLTDHHPDELDPAHMRIAGYERFSGAIYNELVQAIRVHNASLGKSNKQIIMNPYSIWKRITEDPAKIQATELNPIASLKEREAVTYGGVGGRSSLSMTKSTRAYHKNDMGTISEATTDNADVGINVYTSADPNFTSLRGMSKRFDLENPNYTSLLSTAALLAPSSDSDDQKRVDIFIE